MNEKLIEVNRNGFLVIKALKVIEKFTIEWHATEAEAVDAAEAAVDAEPQSELYIVACKAMMRFGPESDGRRSK